MKRILVIDDDADQREFYRMVLEEADYEVMEAQDGEKGLRLYCKHPCELVITDIFMPEKEGIETILELRRDFPLVKIIAVSGGGIKGGYAGEPGANLALETAKDLGADRILHKPVQLTRFLATVNELLQD